MFHLEAEANERLNKEVTQLRQNLSRALSVAKKRMLPKVPNVLRIFQFDLETFVSMQDYQKFVLATSVGKNSPSRKVLTDLFNNESGEQNTLAVEN